MVARAAVTPADPDVIDPLMLPASLLRELAKLCHIRAPVRRTLLAQEAALALGTYRRRRAQVGAGLDRRSQRDLLRDLEASLQKASLKLNALDANVEGALAIMLRIPQSPGFGGDKLQELRAIIDGVRRLREAAASVSHASFPKGKVSRGRAPNVDLYLLVRDLCDLYERLRRRRLAYAPNKGPLYEGPPQNEGGLFVLTLVQMVEPMVSPSQVSGLIRERNRNRAKERPNGSSSWNNKRRKRR